MHLFAIQFWLYYNPTLQECILSDKSLYKCYVLFVGDYFYMVLQIVVCLKANIDRYMSVIIPAWFCYHHHFSKLMKHSITQYPQWILCYQSSCLQQGMVLQKITFSFLKCVLICSFQGRFILRTDKSLHLSRICITTMHCNKLWIPLSLKNKYIACRWGFQETDWPIYSLQITCWVK